MTEVNKFNFSEFDKGAKIGGQLDGNEVEGDKKLTGAEARAARAAGWTVWDGYSESNGTPENVNQKVNNSQEESVSKLGNKIPKWALDLINGNSQKKPVQKQNILEEISQNIKNLNKEDLQKVVEKILKNTNSVKVNNKPIDDFIADLTGKNDDKLTSEQKEARVQLNQKQSSIGMTYADAKAKVAEILQKYPDCYDEVEVSNEPQPDENGFISMIHREPTKRKVFNPDKLPEPARTEYKEAMASMTEIENANSVLAQKGGIKVTPIKNETTKHSMFDNFDPASFEGIGFKPTSKPEPTASQKSARIKLNEKVSSSGMSYKDAKTTIESITKQYKNNPEYQSEFEQEQPKNVNIYYPPVKAFDPYKLKGADREVYFKALSAIHEIETSNYALLTQAGLEPTKDPEKPQNKYKYFADNN